MEQNSWEERALEEEGFLHTFIEERKKLLKEKRKDSIKILKKLGDHHKNRPPSLLSLFSFFS